MGVHEQLIRHLADDAGRQVAERAAKYLRSLRVCLSGADSGLENTWEEFCVQVQSDESFFWDAYVDTVKDAIEGELTSVQPHELIAMWLQTDAGIDWAADEEEGEPPVMVRPDVVDWVYELVWKLADASRHPRVVRYLYLAEAGREHD